MSRPLGSDGKESACNVGDPGLIPLGWEDPVDKEMATHSSILAWRIPWPRSLVGYSPCVEKSWTWLSDWQFYTFKPSEQQRFDKSCLSSLIKNLWEFFSGCLVLSIRLLFCEKASLGTFHSQESMIVNLGLNAQDKLHKKLLDWPFPDSHEFFSI